MKRLKFLLIFFCVLLLQGCVFNNPKYLNLKSKPNDYYYSNQVYKKIKNNDSFTLTVFDSDFYRYYPVAEEDTDIVLSFFKSLNTENYTTDNNSQSKSRYELSIKFNDEKYIFNVYSKDLVTLYPWDGNFKEDMITMNGVPARNNIYDFCVYVINKAHQN